MKTASVPHGAGAFYCLSRHGGQLDDQSITPHSRTAAKTAVLCFAFQ
ncbi:MAG: hypothetical protein IJ642_05630 [Oscillospiraceae bacterium]|nr:hypothetical protein [Oscillospiraceae bacterium]